MSQLPQGMSEEDYEAIEAAVTETVRGRWFLHEFARRNRAGEMREILAAVTRLEGSFGSLGPAGQTVLPADPSVRLLMQRVKEISGQLDRLAGAMRLADADERFIRTVEEQGRAVAGMMRGPTLPTKPIAQPVPQPFGQPDGQPVAQPFLRPEPAPAAPPMLAAPVATPPAKPVAMSVASAEPDPRLRELEGIDQLPLAEKIALFA